MTMLKNYFAEFWVKIKTLLNQSSDTDQALENPHKVLNNETKIYFQENIFSLMFNLEPQFNLFIKQIIVCICKQNKGYLNCWPQLMEVKIKL